MSGDRCWLFADVAIDDPSVRSGPESRPPSANVRFRPADDGFYVGSGPLRVESRCLILTDSGKGPMILKRTPFERMRLGK